MSDPGDPPDLESLARRYLDLWQDQVAALAEDADLAEQIGRLLALFGSAMKTGATTGQGKAGDASTTDDHPAAGAAAAALSPGDGDGRVARLARRLADVERRLARLEVGKPRPRARRGAPQRRS